MQSHYDLFITEEQIEDIYKDFSATGKEIQVTEMDVTPGYDRGGCHLPYDSQNMPKYEKIWNKVFRCAKAHGAKAFTGWGISDALSWYKNIGRTMVSEDGSIKEFAMEFFKDKHIENDTQGITFQEIGKGTTQSFSKNPAGASKAMDSLKYGIKAQEEMKEGKTQEEG